MTETTLTGTVTQSRALVGDALQGATPQLHCASRAELVAVLQASQQLINTVTAAQQQALAHLAAIDDVRDQHGDWVEQHRGLGHHDIGAAGEAAGVMGLSEGAAGHRIDDAIHQVTITPQIHTAVASGELDQWRAHVITAELSACPDDVAATIAGHLTGLYERRGGWVDSAGPLRSRTRALNLETRPGGRVSTGLCKRGVFNLKESV